jgi:autotransporter-associated beta strand protein
MKPSANPFLILSAACIAIGIPCASAATWTGSTDASWATAGNWTGTAPDNTTPQAIVFDGSSTANLTQTLDGSYTLTGITLSSPAGTVTVNEGSGTNTLTIGSGGIDLSSADQNLSLGSTTSGSGFNVLVGANQSWNVGSGRTLTMGQQGGTFTLDANLTKTGDGTFNLGGSGATTLTGSGILEINGGTFTNNMQSGSSSTGRTGATTLTSGNLVVSTSISMFGSGALNLNGGAIGSGTGTGRVFDNSVNIGGNIQIGGSSPLSTSFIRFNGAADLGGATREITAIANGVNTNFGSGAIFTGVISNGGITKAGGGILTLTNDSNTFTGTTTVNAGNLAVSNGALASSSSVILANSGAVISLGINGTTTVNNFSGVSGSQVRTDFTITGGTGSRILSVNQTTDGTFDGSFTQGSSRPISLVKTGSAILTLTGTGTYTGSTTVSAGTLKIGGAGLLGSGTYAGAITNDATLHFDSTALQTLSGTISGSGTLLKSGIGTLTLGGDASGFVGNTTVSGGRLFLNGTLGGNVTASSGGAVGGTGSSTGDLDMTTGSTLLLTGGATTTGVSFDGVSFGGTVYLEFASSPDDATVYDVVTYGAGGRTGFASLSPLARGTLNDDTANSKITFTAGAPGTRTWDTGDGIWDRFGTLANWAEGDQVYYQGDDVIFGDIASDTTITLDGLLSPFSVTVENTTNTYTFTGTGGLSGGGFFDKPGAGTLVIANPNPNFTGLTAILAGTLRFVDGGSWGTGAIGNDATLEVDQTTNLTLSGTISGTGSLIKNGTGALTLGGGSSYSGGTTLNGGLIRLENNTALGTGTLTANNGTLGRNAARTIANDIDVPGTLNLGGTGQNNGNLTLSGTLSGDGAITNISGITILTGTNTFSGSIEVQGTPAEGFDVVLNSAGSVDGEPDLHMTGGRFILATPFVGGTATIGNLTGTDGIINPQFGATTGVRTLQVNQTTNGTFAGNIQDGGGGRFVGLTKTGAATLTLSGTNNTYTGDTTVNQGTLELADDAQLKFVLGATSGTNNAISGAGTVILNGDFVIDTTAADALENGSWTLEDVDTLTGAYGSTFSVVGFTDAGGNKWTKQNGPTKVYTFDETTGILTLGSTAGFSSWASLNGAGTNLSDDHDGDGVDNGTEYFLGGPNGNTTGFTALPGVVNTGGILSVTWPKGAGYSGVYGTDFTVETSATLSDPWTTESVGVNVTDSASEVTYTFPAPYTGRNFVRLKVTGP